MNKKLRYGLSKKAIKGTPPQWVIYGTAIVALLLSAQHYLVNDLPGATDQVKDTIGEWFDYILNFAQLVFALAVIFTGYDETDKPDTDYPSYNKVVLLLIGIALLSACSRKTLVTRTSDTLDSNWTTLKKVTIPVKGGTTPGVNMDSLRRLFEDYRKRYSQVNNNPETPGIMLPPLLLRDTLVVSDTSGRYELQYWISATGELMARCVGKDTLIETLVEQNNRLIKKVETLERKKTIYKWPPWLKVILWIAVIALIAWIVKGLLSYYKKGKIKL